MKKIWVNKTTSFKEAEKFNIRFWCSIPPRRRLEAMWGLVKDFYKLKNKSGNKLRLQRSIQNIKRG